MAKDSKIDTYLNQFFLINTVSKLFVFIFAVITIMIFILYIFTNEYEETFVLVLGFVVGCTGATLIFYIYKQVYNNLFIKCSHCGKINRGDSRFCVDCETKITGFEKIVKKLKGGPCDTKKR